MTATPADMDVIHERMAVPDEPGLYVLGCLERPATLYMQQVRALNLIYALGRSCNADGRSMAVVGAGAAGLTAAAAAAILGWRVTVLEKHEGRVLALAGDITRQRWLHPRIYDWPADGAETDASELGVLDWSAGEASTVVAGLRAQWQEIETRFGIATYTGVADVTLGRLDDDGLLLQWNGAEAAIDRKGEAAWGRRHGRRHRQFSADIVVLAVGFGREESSTEFPEVTSYWKNDNIDQIREGAATRPTVLVSGTGDGGLIDALRFSFHEFRHAEVVRQLRENWLGEAQFDRVRAELHGIEHRVRALRYAGQPYEARLNHAYRQLADELELLAPIPMREDVAVVLTGRGRYPLTLEAAPINRFLFALTNAQYRPGPIVAAKRVVGKDLWEVQFEGSAQTENFADVVIRHGPRARLALDFPDIDAKARGARAGWDDAKRFVPDPTREPMFDDTLCEALRAATKNRPAKATTTADVLPPAALDDNPLEAYRTALARHLDTAFALALPVDQSLAAHLAVLTPFATSSPGRAIDGSGKGRIRLVLGDAGAGKTTLLQHLARRVLETPSVVPLLVQAAALGSEVESPPFVRAIDAALAPLDVTGTVLDRTRAALLSAVVQGRVVVLVDGLDELPSDQIEFVASEFVRADVDLDRGNRAVFACRPAVLPPGLGPFESLELTEPPPADARDRTAVGSAEAGDLAALLGKWAGKALDAISLGADAQRALEDAALASLLGRDVSALLALHKDELVRRKTSSLWAWGAQPDVSNPAGGWRWHPVVREALAAAALQRRAHGMEPLIGLALDEHLARGNALPHVLAQRAGADEALDAPRDTLDFRFLRLRLETVRAGAKLDPERIARLARRVAEIVKDEDLASFETAMQLAARCRGLPQALALRLYEEIADGESLATWRVRYRVLRFLGAAALPPAVGLLLAHLRSLDEALGDAAAEALADLRDAAAVPALVQAYRTAQRTMVFSAAITAIQTIGGEAAARALATLLGDHELYQNLRWPAAVALGKLALGSALEPLLAAATDNSAVVRKAVAEALGSFNSRAAIDALLGLAGDSQDGVRIEAVRGLALRAELGDIDALWRALEDPHVVVRESALDGLERLDRESLLRALHRGLRDGNARWREESAAALGRMLGPAAIDTLCVLARDSDRETRTGAARGLSGQLDPRALEALVQLARDEDEHVRYAAVDALPTVDSPAVVGALVDALDEGLTSPAILAAKRLAQHRGPTVLQALRRTAARQDFIGVLASGSLGVVGTSEDIDLLSTAWRAMVATSQPERSYGVHDLRARAIAHIGGPTALAALRQMMCEVDQPALRGQVLEALVELHDANPVPPLLLALEGGEAVFCGPVRLALARLPFVTVRTGLKLALAAASPGMQRAAADVAPPYADEELLALLRGVDVEVWGADGVRMRDELVNAAEHIVEASTSARALLSDLPA